MFLCAVAVGVVVGLFRRGFRASNRCDSSFSASNSGIAREFAANGIIGKSLVHGDAAQQWSLHYLGQLQLLQVSDDGIHNCFRRHVQLVAVCHDEGHLSLLEPRENWLRLLLVDLNPFFDDFWRIV